MDTLPTLEQIDRIATDLAAALNAKIAEVEGERTEMCLAYDQQLSDLKARRNRLTGGITSAPSVGSTGNPDAADKIIKYLRANPGWQTATTIRTKCGNICGRTDLILDPLISGGLVEYETDGRHDRYRIKGISIPLLKINNTFEDKK